MVHYDLMTIDSNQHRINFHVLLGFMSSFFVFFPSVVSLCILLFWASKSRVHIESRGLYMLLAFLIEKDRLDRGDLVSTTGLSGYPDYVVEAVPGNSCIYAYIVLAQLRSY